MLTVLLVVITAVLIYLVGVKPFFYWKDRNVKTTRTIPFFGENFWVLLGQESFLNQIFRIYQSYPNERYFGFYQFTRPVLLLKSPQLIRELCVKNFDHVLNRHSFLPDSVEDLLSGNLISLKGQKWKDMRSTLSPVFTSSKMKAMFSLISQNAERFVNHFSQQNSEIVEVELKDAMSRFTNDAIASAVYGLKVDSLKDRNNKFYEMGRKGTDFVGWRITITIFMYQLVPKIAEFLGLKLIKQEVESFYFNLVKDTIEMKKTQKTKSSDVVAVLTAAKDNPVQTNEKEEERDGFAVVEEHLESKGIKEDLSVMEVATQTFLFFIAGFEGVSNLLCFLSYELAVNPDVQKRLIEEVDENCSDGILPSYGKIMNMEYLDMVVCETLRKWPFALVTDRVVNKTYEIQAENHDEPPLILEPGTVIMIPIAGLQRDPKNFENPDKFDPERFSPENRTKIDPYTYLPFGVGPRNCIGNRFALMEVKALISKILCHFEIVPIARTQIPLVMNKRAFSFIPTDGFHLGLKRRN